LQSVLDHNHNRLLEIVGETRAKMLTMMQAHTPANVWSA